jgi:hypothetical protein
MLPRFLSRHTRPFAVVAAIGAAALAGSYRSAQPAKAYAPSLAVFSESLAGPWSSWSWNAGVNFANTAPVYYGSRSIAVTITAPWGGLYLHTPTPVTLPSDATLNFALRASQAGQQLSVYLEDMSNRPLGGKVLLANVGGNPPAGAWKYYSVTLAQLGGVGKQVAGIVLQDESGKAQPVMYADEIGFWSNTPATTATPKPATPAPTAVRTATPPAVAPTRTPAPPAPATPAPAPPGSSKYPLHTGIVSTTFWVGEIFDPTASDGSQVYSTYDTIWETHYGGCDGVLVNNVCQTEPRTAANNYFPTHMTPRENPFYLDLPFDDLNDATAYAERGSVVPWASQAPYAGHAADPSVSFMKNRWVKLMMNGHTCYAQIEDAGPHDYHDAPYVFGRANPRPVSTAFNGAGMDVSPAVNGCLGYQELDGESDVVSWQFVDDQDVPPGPWKILVTTSGVDQ